MEVKEILKEVFKAANIAPPSEITDESLLEAVFKLKQSLLFLHKFKNF